MGNKRPDSSTTRKATTTIDIRKKLRYGVIVIYHSVPRAYVSSLDSYTAYHHPNDRIHNDVCVYFVRKCVDVRYQDVPNARQWYMAQIETNVRGGYWRTLQTMHTDTPYLQRKHQYNQQNEN